MANPQPPNPFPWGALADTGGSIFNTIWNSITAKQNSDRTIRSQKEMTDYAHQKDLEMWDTMNKYNLPSAQMARLKGAGINPNTVFGSGQVAGNTTNQMAKYQAIRPEHKRANPQIPMTANLWADLEIKKAQARNLEADTQNKLSGKNFTDTKNAGAIISNEIAEAVKENKIAMSTEELNLIKERVKNLAQDTKTKESTATLNAAKTTWQEKENEWRKMGITSSDHYLLRLAAQITNGTQIDPLEIGQILIDKYLSGELEEEIIQLIPKF